MTHDAHLACEQMTAAEFVSAARLEAVRARLSPMMPRIEPRLWISAVGTLVLAAAAIAIAVL